MELKQNLQRRLGVFCMLLLVCESTRALELNFGANGSSRTTDNALRVSESEDAISERQDVYGAVVQASHQSERIVLEADYALSYTVFSEQSQQDRDTKVGRSSLMLGGGGDVFNLALEHSVQLTLVDPSDVQVLQNIGERSISLARPSLNFRISSVDRLIVSGQYQEIKFEEQPQSDSIREGFSLGWQRRLDSVSALGVEVASNDVKFDAFPLANYTVEYASLNYSARLRNIQYSVSVGRNRSSREGSAYSGGRYNLDVSYSQSDTQIGVQASKQLTDNSQGGGNQAPLSDLNFGGEGGFDGSFSGAEQIERRQTEFFISNQSLCSRCEIRFSWQLLEEAYLIQDVQDNEQANLTFSFSYAMNARSGFDIQYSQSEREFAGLPERDFELERETATYRYSLNQALSINVFGSRRSRENTNTPEEIVKENQYGLSLGYRF